MCRHDMDPVARGALVALLNDLAEALADEVGMDPADVAIGPVDFGEELLPDPLRMDE